MMKRLVIAMILKMLDAAEAYTASTPDPLDDMMLSMLRSFLEKLITANSHSEIVAAADSAKVSFNKAFPQP